MNLNIPWVYIYIYVYHYQGPADDYDDDDAFLKNIMFKKQLGNGAHTPNIPQPLPGLVSKHNHLVHIYICIYNVDI